MAEFNPNEAFAIVDYDPAWPERFAREAAAIRAVMGDETVELEHIGSTSVPGLPAKPTIDMLLAVDTFAPLDHYDALLAPLGYTHQPHVNDSERLFFWKGSPRVYHLHIVEYATWEHQRHLLFRDYLRAHADVAERYATLKRALAQRFQHDRTAYTSAKSEFIYSTVEQAVAALSEADSDRRPGRP